MRVNHRFRIGKLFSGLMVVGDDEPYSKLSAKLCFIYGGNAVVHGDDKGNALFVKLSHGVYVHSVALGTLVDICHNISADIRKISRQHSSRSNSVTVIVAVNADKLAAVHSVVQYIAGLFHITDKERV